MIIAAGFLPIRKVLLPQRASTCLSFFAEASARGLERYFKSGSGKAFAKKRFLQKTK
jgi:putative endonuclease